MANTIHVDIVDAEKEIFAGEAEFLSAPAIEGEVGILPKHTPLLCKMKPGEVMVRLPDGQEQSFYVSGGILEVQPDLVTVLADVGSRTEDLVEAQVREAQENARKLLEGADPSIDYKRARAELAEAVAQLQAIERLRSKV